MSIAGTFWTTPHLFGITLIIGCVLFFTGAGQYGMVKDEKGRLIQGCYLMPSFGRYDLVGELAQQLMRPEPAISD